MMRKALRAASQAPRVPRRDPRRDPTQLRGVAPPRRFEDDQAPAQRRAHPRQAAQGDGGLDHVNPVVRKGKQLRAHEPRRTRRVAVSARKRDDARLEARRGTRRLFLFFGSGVETRGAFIRGTRLGRDLGRVLDARRGTRNATFVFDQLLGSRATPERSQRVPSFVRSARGEARAVRPLARRSRRERGSRTRRRKKRLYVHPALVARRAPGAGVGVFAENTISPGHVLFRAPSFLFESLSAAHAPKPSRAAPRRVRRAVRAGLRRVGRAGVRAARALRASRALRAGGRAVSQLRVPRVSARAIGGGGG